ncbi:MAG: magnesium transporter [Hyphomicrobiales bacterium]|nr:magnesium transporter [Hyphomicrobiales bacterium]
MSDSENHPGDDPLVQDPYAYHLEYYSEDGALRPEFVERIEQAVQERDANILIALINPLHESDLGEILAAIDPATRTDLVELAGNDFDFSALTEVDETIRLEVVNALPNAKVAEALDELDSDDAVFILEDMEAEDREEILEQMPFEESVRLRRSLEYPEETAGRRMQTEFVAVPPFWTIGQSIDYLRVADNLPDRFHEIFVVTPQFELIGSMDLDRFLKAKRDQNVGEIQNDTQHPIRADMDQEEAAQIFEKYDLLSAAVIDESNRLVGVMTIDDVVDVIHQEVEEDIKRLVGVGDEEISDRMIESVKSRFTWLLVNLATSILASFVIGMFDATINEMVALAILMPIVASMGGNAGTQTMTVAVRALATRDIDIYNAGRVIIRELNIGVFNGILFAMIIGPVAAIWFDNWTLGLIISTAMVVNMICAAAAGIFIPLLLDRLDIDPAIASSVFVTTVTDVVGFAAFLGLAAWWLGFA